MSKVLDLIFIISLVAFVVFWWKKRKARLAAGETYASDATYQKISGKKRWSGIVCVASFAISVVLNALSDGAEMIDGIKNLFNLVFVATLLAFVYYWRKKASARKAAGDNYQSDESYLRINKIKRIIGGVCAASLFLSVITPNSAAEEHKQAVKEAQRQAYEAQRQAYEEQTSGKGVQISMVDSDYTPPDSATKYHTKATLIEWHCNNCKKSETFVSWDGAKEGGISKEAWNESCPKGEHHSWKMYHSKVWDAVDGKKWKKIHDKYYKD